MLGWLLALPEIVGRIPFCLNVRALWNISGQDDVWTVPDFHADTWTISEPTNVWTIEEDSGA